jgi:hypothetical protein
LGDFFENFSILEVEIGRNGPGILGVNWEMIISFWMVQLYRVLAECTNDTVAIQ